MKKFSVEWTQNAEYDLISIIEYIKLDSLTIAKDIFFEIKKVCESLDQMPERQKIVPELQQIGIAKYRELIFKRWRIIFKIEETTVWVLLVADSRRNLEDILFQRLMRSGEK